jgi:hypothetical protein
MRDLASSTGLSTRSRVRDTLTGFDEDGIVVASTRPELLALIREFRWRELFWAQRDAWATALHVFPFGHALMEKLLDPFLGLTAKAVLLVVTDDFVTMNPQQRLEHIDERVSDRLSSEANFATPQWLSPLPILGIPGWHPDNEHPAFYDNTQYFRTGRSAPPQVISQDVRT